MPPEESMKAKILYKFHDNSLARHFNVNRTEELIQWHFQRKNIRKEVWEYVRLCAIYQQVISKRHKPCREMVTLLKPTRLWNKLSIDFIVELPRTTRNLAEVDSILITVNRYTHIAKFFVISKTINVAELARLFHNEIELKFRHPNSIVSN